MIVDYKYTDNTYIDNSSAGTKMSFAPDLLREPTFFTGKLNKKVAFREAISALHDVVVSDLRFKPKDKTEYKAWVAEQEKIWLGEYMAEFEIEEVRFRINEIKKELSELYEEKNKVLAPFNQAKQKYFDYLYQNDPDAWYVLDPVITVHPDEVFFECFSQDESSYGKLSCNYNVFNEINEFKCGTTNIDYSAELYGEFQKIRGYKDTQFSIDSSGFEMKTTYEEVYKEIKIDLPDSWVRGFLQVSTAMTLPSAVFNLHPMDIYSICQYLRRFKEKEGPRALRFLLEPDKPVRLVIEPWGKILTFYRSVYHGDSKKDIRVWGRRRLFILERLIPIAKSFKVFLLGSGMPSFYVADLGDMSFTLGLSGWTANDWSRLGNFDLMAPRNEVDILTKKRVFNRLKESWFDTSQHLAEKLNLHSSVVQSVLTSYTQTGNVIYDLNSGVYRIRELSNKPLDIEDLRFTSEQEKLAEELVNEGRVKNLKFKIQDKKLFLTAEVYDKNSVFHTSAVIDNDQRLIDAQCDCDHFKRNRLRKGPCEHILAIRLQYQKNKIYANKM
ncbi:SWIM zinc finger domain-containing protein [Apibacter raozihei]|uniref:SWIM zinc finger family protein n=1 Tax=Apibacter raozihei TaxID=2500547 RepID=UPI000FE382C7|nr:SWIM zinc finger family protein [Apibacter raozihei]